MLIHTWPRLKYRNIAFRCPNEFKNIREADIFIVGRISFALIGVPWSIERFQFLLAMNQAYPGHWTSFAAYPAVRGLMQIRLQLHFQIGRLIQHPPLLHRLWPRQLQYHLHLLSSRDLSSYHTLSKNKYPSIFIVPILLGASSLTLNLLSRIWVMDRMFVISSILLVPSLIFSAWISTSYKNVQTS